MKPFFRRSGLVGLLGATALAAGQAQAAATILLWPIDPWLSAEARATELCPESGQQRHDNAGAYCALEAGGRI